MSKFLVKFNSFGFLFVIRKTFFDFVKNLIRLIRITDAPPFSYEG